MPKRSYNQYCGLAAALDVLGERWTLLVLRNLFLGPQRYSDLLDGLPGISTDLLAERLRDLEREGMVVRRRLPPPAASTVYELTNAGRELEPALVHLARWGTRRLGAPAQSQVFRPAWGVLAIKATFQREAALGLHATYEFTIDEEVFYVSVNDGTADVYRGAAPDDADLKVACDSSTFLRLASRQLTAREAVAARTIEIQKGTLRVLEQALATFGIAG